MPATSDQQLSYAISPWQPTPKLNGQAEDYTLAAEYPHTMFTCYSMSMSTLHSCLIPSILIQIDMSIP